MRSTRPVPGARAGHGRRAARARGGRGPGPVRADVHEPARRPDGRGARRRPATTSATASRRVRAARRELGARRDARVDRRRHPRRRPARVASRAGNQRFAEMWRIPGRTCWKHATTAGRSRSCSSSCAIPRPSSHQDPGALRRARGSTATTPSSSRTGGSSSATRCPSASTARSSGGCGASATSPSTAGSQNELTHQAFHDPLTGLANQALFRDRVEHATHAARSATVASSRCCSSTSTTSRPSTTASATPSGDAPARDRERAAHELPARRRHRRPARRRRVRGAHGRRSTTPTTRSTVAERIIAALQETGRARLVAGRARPRASGSRTARAAPAADELLRNADLAMYTAKAQRQELPPSRSRPRCTSPRSSGSTSKRTSAARPSGASCVVHYQPIYELRSGRRHRRSRRSCAGTTPSAACSARSRSSRSPRRAGSSTRSVSTCWRPRADEAAPVVGRARAGHAAAVDQRQRRRPASCSTRDLPDRVEALLARCGLAPRALILEITEGALMKDPPAAIDALRRAAASSACASRSTTSAPATRRSRTCSSSRSTCSRSTARS